MKRTILSLLLLTGVMLLVSACGLLQEPEEASSIIEATPLVIATSTSQPDIETEESGGEMEEAVDVESETDPAAAGELLIYKISQADSDVRFELDEDLRGVRKTVVGTTDQVAGEIAVDLSDLSNVQAGVIQINARTLTTDNNFRNRAIQNQILNTGEFEFITFTPTAISGLPASAGVGEEVTFTIEGDLTIRDITRPVVFTVVAMADSDGTIFGTAATIIMRADYNLNIPSVPNVANVEEEVELYIDFIATASNG